MKKYETEILCIMCGKELEESEMHFPSDEVYRQYELGFGICYCEECVNIKMLGISK